MAKRSQKSPQATSGGESAEAIPRGEVTAENQFVVFKCAGSVFAFRLDDIGEILRFPRVVHMPLAPKSLLGLANLRGTVLPVVSLPSLLGLRSSGPDEASRVIVMAQGSPLGFVVDRIDNLMSFTRDRIETGDAGAGVIDPDLLDGVVKTAEGGDTIKILNPKRLFKQEFARIGLSATREKGAVSISAPSSLSVAPLQSRVSLISFELQKQEYGVPLERVLEIIQLPAHISEVPRANTAVLGVVTLRDRLLPLVSLRALLGLPAVSEPEQRSKVLVLAMGRGSVGFVADRTKEILHVDPNVIDPAPALLTRGQGDAEITSICRLDHGKRLVALLSPDRLFRSELMSRIVSEKGDVADALGDGTDGTTMDEEQFVIFNLGAQEYGLPIEAVQEIARPPDHVTKLPKAPAFIDGVMNLRGSVVPIVDLRRRFDVAAKEHASAQRILVLALGGGQTGFMVDGVSEVLKVPSSAIRPAPDLSPEQVRLIKRVANLEWQERMILLVDPAQLLDQVETDVLAKFDRTNADKALKAS
jgi:purine-binding chemotaxis protein CheW